MTPRVSMSPSAREPTTSGGGPALARAPAPKISARVPTPTSIARSTGSGAFRLQDDGRAISDDLAHGLADLRGIETHHDHAVGPHGRGVLDHAVDRLAPRFLQRAGVFVDLATDDRAQPGHEIAADAAAAHDHPEALSLDLSYPLPRDAFTGRDQHLDPP